MPISTRLGNQNHLGDSKSALGHALFGHSKACAEAVNAGRPCKDPIMSSTYGKQISIKKLEQFFLCLK